MLITLALGNTAVNARLIQRPAVYKTVTLRFIPILFTRSERLTNGGLAVVVKRAASRLARRRIGVVLITLGLFYARRDVIQVSTV